jgi:sortase A
MKILPIVLLCMGLVLLADGVYIQAKARLAQHLIAESWAEGQQKPWPWADTWPVARLRFKEVDSYVLAGAHGSALAFGPGHVDGTALPGKPGASVIAGHRDTHFGYLEDIQLDDKLAIQTIDSVWHEYRVISVEIIDTRKRDRFTLNTDRSLLVLITCYPFDAINPGGPLRYVVTATPGSDSTPAR